MGGVRLVHSRNQTGTNGSGRKCIICLGDFYFVFEPGSPLNHLLVFLFTVISHILDTSGSHGWRVNSQTFLVLFREMKLKVLHISVFNDLVSALFSLLFVSFYRETDWKQTVQCQLMKATLLAVLHASRCFADTSGKDATRKTLVHCHTAVTQKPPNYI